MRVLSPTSDAGPEATARRSTELGLVVLAVILAAGGYVLTGLAKGARLPADLAPFAAGAAALAVVAHLAVRRFAPRADGTLLGLAILLNGVGFVTIARLDADLARYQSLWTAVGVVAFVVTLRFVQRIRDLERYRYTFAAGRDRVAADVGPPRDRAGDQRRPPVGAARSAQLPAR